MAGLRTNTLVAIGAASFVIFARLFPDGRRPTQLTAEVVFGIGFLGAGINFREGLHVTGVQRPSAARGLATSFVVLFNLSCGPLVRIINRQLITQAETDFHRVRVVAETPKRRMSAPCFCRALATVNSVCCS